MDRIDGQVFSKCIIIGLLSVDQKYKYWPDKKTVDSSEVLQVSNKVVHDSFPELHGVAYGTRLSRLPRILNANWGVMFRWNRNNRA